MTSLNDLHTVNRALRIFALSVLSFAIIASSGIGGSGQAQTTIKIIVNDSPITSYDISNREKFLRLISRGRAGRQQAIDELINEKLKTQEAKRRNVTASDADVDRAFAGIARNAKLTPAKLTAALRRQGVNPITLKNRIRADIVWAKLVRAEARTAVKVTEKDVLDAIGADANTETQIAEYNLQQILFVVPAKSSTKYRSQRKREAERFRSQVTSCDQTRTLAKGLRDVTIKPTRRANEQQLADLAEEIAGTPVGKATRPKASSSGYEMFAVCAKKTISGTSSEGAGARNKLMGAETNRFAQQKLRDLRSEAMIERR